MTTNHNIEFSMSDITNQQLLDGLTQQLGTISDNMATKQDLDGMATKPDLAELKLELSSKIDSLETGIYAKIDTLTEKIDGIGDRVVVIADNMATTKDLSGVETRLTMKIDAIDIKLDDTELRLGRRIDRAQFVPKPAR